MAIITGNKTSPGLRYRSAADQNTDGSLGPFVNAGVPTGSTFAGVAAKGAMLIDTSGANIYINAGTLATPSWKLVTRAA